MNFLFKLTKRQALARSAAFILSGFAACSHGDVPASPLAPDRSAPARARAAICTQALGASFSDATLMCRGVAARTVDSHRHRHGARE